MKFILACVFISIITFNSCKQTVIVYYNDIRDYDDGEIWGSDLKMFFKNDSDIEIVINQLTSKKILEELTRIKKELIFKGNEIARNDSFNIEWDDNFYDYAFVFNKKDTLYTSLTQNIWRYKKQKLELKSSVENLLKEQGIAPQKPTD